ncbi:MAG: SMC-Scp complex subunit ScpB [Acidobacteria bacterium]|nr:SMC-Scp complex subunit ScpB [Acidobacteriota bacterium]
MSEEIQNTTFNEEDLDIEANEELTEQLADEAEQTPEPEAVAEELPAGLELAANLDLPPILDMFDEETGEAKFSEDAALEESLEAEGDETAPGSAEEQITATRDELKPVIESLLFVADEPLPFKQLCKVLGEVPEEDVRAALEELVADLEARNSGLEIREIGGGWRLSTRPQNHEFIRKYLKSRPSARLSLPGLETLAVIAYKQPITIPEILEIRGVSSSSAIKTLLEKRLIVTKGRKETVGRPMMYGTSREFLIQFGLKDLNELPSFEDFEDLAQ